MNNMVNINLEFVDSGSSMNVGGTINIRPSSVVKRLGVAFSIGNHSLNMTTGINLQLDPDLIDQLNFPL